MDQKKARQLKFERHEQANRKKIDKDYLRYSPPAGTTSTGNSSQGRSRSVSDLSGTSLSSLSSLGSPVKLSAKKPV